MSDLISYICQRAANRFGGGDGTFNCANFSIVWTEVTGLYGGLDGNAVRAILHGRSDVEWLGDAHFRLDRASGKGEPK